MADAEPVFALGAVTALVAAGVPAAVATADPRPGGPRGQALAARLIEEVAAREAHGLLVDASLGEHPYAADVVAAVVAAAPGLATAVTVGQVRLVGLLDVVQAGARALVHRGGTPAELHAGVTAALRGQSWVAGPLAARLRAELLAAPSDSRALTPRERDVLRGVAAGGTNADIGRRLGISAHTVRNHVHSLLDKLDAANRTDAVATAVRRGLVDLAE